MYTTFYYRIIFCTAYERKYKQGKTIVKNWIANVWTPTNPLCVLDGGRLPVLTVLPISSGS